MISIAKRSPATVMSTRPERNKYSAMVSIREGLSWRRATYAQNVLARKVTLAMETRVATANLFPCRTFTILTTVMQTPTSVEAAGKM